MNGGVTPRAPASAHLQIAGMFGLPYHDLARAQLILSVTFQAQIIVPLHEHFGIDGTMGRVADRTTLPHCRVLVNEWPGLLAMALRAALIEA